MVPPGNSGNFRDCAARARVMTLCRRDTAGKLPNWVSSDFKVGSNCKVARLFRETNYYGDALRFSFRDMYMRERTRNPWCISRRSLVTAFSIMQKLLRCPGIALGGHVSR